MNPQNSNGWPPAPGGAPPPANNEHASGQQRQPGAFGPTQSQPMHQPPPSQMNGPSILHQSGPFFASQSNGHSLPNPPGLPQVQPLQPGRGPPPAQQQQSPTSVQHHAVQAPGYPLPTLGPSLQQQQQSPQAAFSADQNFERERLREQQMQQELAQQRRYDQESEILHQQQEQQQREQQQREQQQREQQQREQQQREQQQREQQQREQQQREQQQREQHQSPRENHAAAVPIQQPVASRVPATLHGPNGILNDQHPGVGTAPPPPQAPLGAPSGPGNVFGNSVQTASDNSLRPFVQQVQQPIPPQNLLGFSNAVTPQQLPNGVPALSQGQQPILNDALSYLDQVKVRFQHQPDVYNQFLDIMKDFKSQAIDTPGVIDRVSSLFAGHPELIQGFNTFLPPGYRIECGTRDDPNAIRVTTPMGTTVSQMPSAQNRINGGPNDLSVIDNLRQGLFQDSSQANGEWPNSQHDEDPPGSLLARQGGQPLFPGQVNMGNDNGGPYERDEQGAVSEAALIAHQQEQRGVSHLSNAVSAVATNGAPGRQTLAQVSPSAGQVTLGQAAAGLSNAAINSSVQLGMERRGPVEFNHAIGYVNKIKNRFATQPEIYKQFLEILQTYQKESKPIQDVYAQVTQLFNSAPDLLEDFKQFLPESAAQAKAQAAAKQAEDAAMLSNVRGEYGPGSVQTQMQTPRPEMKMPPVGNFAPPSATKVENKKRRGGPGSQMTGGAAAIDPGVGTSGQNIRNGVGRGNANKRARVEPAKPAVPENPPVSPTLVPSLPTPMPPTKDIGSISDQLAFFDRVKKFVGDKKTYNEFLKLCNLFVQELIDKNLLMHKAHGFIGGNNELMNWFKAFIKYDGRDEIIENLPKIPGDKVVLSNCRGLGPSYRLLPKRERLRHCSGRDEMCYKVLNDEWVSHPTWASEDSGFIAHRKNTFEESLHRIEEERHDYDINIEACTRTIQLMEPIAQQLANLSPAEKFNFVLPAGIGGQSETIYQRVIKKIYDRERGCKVIEDMFKRPSAVLPVVLGRLKMKAEEWKASQREWEKVWREQTNKIFWKSLDHQGINVKSADKRQFQPKVLQTEIQVRYEEQRRQRIAPWNNVPKYQFKYRFDDVDVIYDACHLILTHLHYMYSANEVDKTRLETFIKTFIPTFFDIDRDTFQARMGDIDDATPPNEEAEDDAGNNDDASGGRSRRPGNVRKSNLLRGVLERGRQGQKEDSVLESKETTPDIHSNDEDTPASTGTPTENPTRVDETEHRWMNHPSTGNKTADLNVPFKRDDFHLYASLNIYCFFRMFEMLYARLSNIKSNEKHVHEDVQRAKMAKTAHELGLVEKKPSDYFADTSPSANYYRQILAMCEDVVKQEMDAPQLEETLRRFYIESGWQLYSFDKMLAALLRFALQILVSDNKDKSLDIINLFYKDRKDDETTHQAELTYRKQVEKLTKDGDIYRIRYTRSTRSVTLQIFKKDDKTYESDELASHARWSYYISTFSMRDVTEGIPLEKLHWPFLKRNMPAPLTDDEDYNNVYGNPQWNEDALVMRISPNSYHILYDPDTEEWFVHNIPVRKRGLSAYEEASKERKDKFAKMFGEKGTLLSEIEGEKLDEDNEEYKRWIQDGPVSVRNGDAAGHQSDGTADDGDEVMGGT